MKTPPRAATSATTTAKDEPRNVAVIVLKNRTKIGAAIVAAGPCDFPLSKTEADALVGLGLVRITGLF